MDNMSLSDINKRICDRTNCFYWQSDRKISVAEAALVWEDRHSPISNEELLESVSKELKDVKLVSIKPFDENAQTSFGSVNSSRIGILDNGKEVIIRCHPKGVKNGYFFVESLAASIALKSRVPAYTTYAIHELQHENDIAYQVIEKVDGSSISFYLKEHPEDEKKLVYEMGKTMAKLHNIKVNGFGPFDNEMAKKGELVGIHPTLSSAINAGLDDNLKLLVENKLFSADVADKIKKLFTDNPLLNAEYAVLVHNDFADWNLLTDSNTVSAAVDWDECVGGDPVEEIACWSLFFDPQRLSQFISGYFSETEKYENFEERLQLMRLRYVVSKMTLRLKRYEYYKSDFVKNMIEIGKKHLEELIQYFNLEIDNV